MLHEIRPAWKWKHETRSVQIIGERLYARVQANFDDQDKVQTFLPTVRLGTSKLVLDRCEKDRLLARVPSDLPVGWFDVTVIGARERQSTLKRAFEVRAVGRDGGLDAWFDASGDLPTDRGGTRSIRGYRARSLASGPAAA